MVLLSSRIFYGWLKGRDRQRAETVDPGRSERVLKDRIKQVDYWYRHSRRITAALWLTGIFFISGVTAIVSWIVVSALSKAPDGSQAFGLIVFLLMPVYYLLIMFLYSIKGTLSNMIKRSRLKKDLAKVPEGAHPRSKAKQAWDLLPLRAGLPGTPGGALISTVYGASLAPKNDENWLKLARANANVRIATGSSFDVLVLFTGAEFNFFSGELPGISSWFAAPLALVDGLEEEELLVPLLHELFHREAGELKARRLASRMEWFGRLATVFVLMYFAIALFTTKATVRSTQVSPLPFLIALCALWVSLRLFCAWTSFQVSPRALFVAADRHALETVYSPVVVAETIKASLLYSKNHATRFGFWSPFSYQLSRFMFVPVRKRKKEAESLGERVRALGPVSPNGEGDVSPEVSAMNRQVVVIADEVEVIYAELLDSRPLAPRVYSAISYSLTVAMFVFIWIISG